MGNLHRVLAALYPALRLTRHIGKRLRLAQANRLRVLLYHDIAPEQRELFAHQLHWLAVRWAFVTPERFVAMVLGDEPIRGNNLLLTFDDGFASNRTVAEEVLNPMGIRALFLVVSDFAAIESRNEAREFIARNIFPGMAVERVPEHWSNMGWADLEALLEQGHTIGSHTRTHARLSRIASQAGLEDEIVASADALERRLGIRVDHFAYTFGDLASFSPEALAIAKRRFRCVYSGLRGDNSMGVDTVALRRDSAKAHDPLSLLGAFLEGGADFRYRRHTRILDGWVREARIENPG